MVLYAQGNNDWYPGLNADGTRAAAPIPAKKATDYGTESTDGYEPVYRMAVLLRGNYFSPEYIISPAETNLGDGPGKMKVPTTYADMEPGRHYSFALLRIDQMGSGRRSEWRATQNGKAPIISDRNLGPAAGDAAYSNNTSPGEGWRGSVCYNDNHGTFATVNVFATTFQRRSGDEVTESTTTLDDLFADDNDSDGRSGNDAAMVHQDATTYVNQK